MSVIAIASLLATQAPVSILYQPKIGSSYKSSMTMTQTSQMGNSSTSMVVAMKVLALENGFYKLQSTTSNVKISGGRGGTDAAKKGLENSTTLYMDKHFKPKFDSNGKDAVSQMMSGMGSSLAGVTFPSKPVKVGESWTNSIDLGALMSSAAKGQPGAAGMKSTGKINSTYKLLKVDATGILIGMSMNGSVKMNMPAGKNNPSPMSMNMGLAGSGTFTVEKATGIPMNSNMKMSMTMGGIGQGFTMTQTIASKRI